MQGVTKVYHICPNMNPDETVIGKLVIEAAREVGVEHFVYHSVLHPHIEVMNHHWQKLRVEEMLFTSGIPFTILQPAPYMQNLSAQINNIIEKGVLQVPYSINSKFSFLHLDDLAEAAKIIFTERNHLNAVYELAGTEPTSHAEVAEIFGKALGRKVRAERQEIRDWRLGAAGMSEYARENLIRMFEYYDEFGLIGNSNVLKWILKREPISFEKFTENIRSNA
jgi:uncharacterized protein YbjT (DUF2867 family)